jgi:hypothetical protein
VRWCEVARCGVECGVECCGVGAGLGGDGVPPSPSEAHLNFSFERLIRVQPFSPAVQVAMTGVLSKTIEISPKYCAYVVPSKTRAIKQQNGKLVRRTQQ